MSGISFGQVTQRVSVSYWGGQPNDFSDRGSISADGHLVAFESGATNLVAMDTNNHVDVFVRDRIAGITELVSVDSNGIQGDSDSIQPIISADGRYVAFSSFASNLVPGDTNNVLDAFLHDRTTGSTIRLSIGVFGAQGNGISGVDSISSDGRYLSLSSYASNLVPGDTNGLADVFVLDRTTGSLELISKGLSGPANGSSGGSSISRDGRYVAFCSSASNLVLGDTNNLTDAFVADRSTGTITRVSVDSNGNQMHLLPNQEDSIEAWISPDGRYVGFYSLAADLVLGDTNQEFDIFLHDCITGQTERENVDAHGNQAVGHSGGRGSISEGGRFVAFTSWAANLVPGDTNSRPDVFLRDRRFGTIERLSLSSQGHQTSHGSVDGVVSLTPDARYAVFGSDAEELTPGDTNGWMDVLIRDRFGAPEFASACVGGVGGIMACPCQNPPVGANQGCDNSSGSGGAILTASGGTFLSSDSLVLRTSGEKPTALSVVMQGVGVNPSGVTYGQGVRCIAGPLKRLYTKTAQNGNIGAPDFDVGDRQVSVRSAMLGDQILAGASRYYFVAYRDPVVLGGCSSTSTFNCTQTGQVTWSP